jgi:membrane protease YdiL (CAAX protease family)
MASRRRPVLRDWLALGVYVLFLVSLCGVEGANYGLDLLRRCVLKTGTELAVLAALIALPLIAAAYFNRPFEWRWLLLGILIAGFDWSLQSSFPWLGPFRSYYWNWQGFLIATFGIIAFMAANKSITLQEIGVTSSFKPRWWLYLAFCVVVMLLIWIFYHGCRRPLWDPETFWFQGTMPGIREELVLRGVLLAILIRTFESDRPTGWRKHVWPVALISLYFGILHLVAVSEPIQVTLQWSRWYTALLGLVLCWIRTGTGSIWPAVLVHNLINLQWLATYHSWS